MPQNHYHAGYNMPGYLPEMDVYDTYSAEDARQFMISELDRTLDFDALFAEDGDEPETASELLGAKALLKVSDVSDGWNLFSGNVHYWIAPCTDANCEIEDE